MEIRSDGMEKLKRAYMAGQMDKKAYSDAMMPYHNILMEYPAVIADSHYVQSIEISVGGVILNIMDEFVAPQSVRMLLSSRKDARCTSIWVLDFGDVEAEELKMFRKIADLVKPASFFDIGANEGWYSFHMMKKFPGLKCYSFEPIPQTYRRMKKNIEINGQPADGLMNIGLSDRNGTAVLYFNEAETGASSLQNIRENAGLEKVECQIRRLDDVVEENNIDSMDFIKCDVEGNELFVMKGGLDSIKRFRPVIFCEMLRKWSGKFGYHPNDIIKLLGGIGYSCHVIDGDGLRAISEVTEETKETNFFFLHREKHLSIIKALLK